MCVELHQSHSTNLSLSPNPMACSAQHVSDRYKVAPVHDRHIIVAPVEVAALHQHVRRGAQVDGVGVGACARAGGGHAVHGDVVGLLNVQVDLGGISARQT